MSEDTMVKTTNNNPETTEAAPVKRRGRPPKIDQSIFIEMWNKSASLDEVASLLGISKPSCSVRASNLRKAGCDLRQFVRGRKRRAAEEAPMP